jgi:CheY-like chemotaxis protein
MDGRILVIDDDAGAREALSSILGDEGFDVVCVAGGREGLDYLRSAPRPSVILLDLNMPEMDGWEFRSAQKQDPSLCSIPVIVVSAAGPFDRTPIDDINVEIIRKPVEIDKLLQAIQKYC